MVLEKLNMISAISNQGNVRNRLGSHFVCCYFFIQFPPFLLRNLPQQKTRRKLFRKAATTIFYLNARVHQKSANPSSGFTLSATRRYYYICIFVFCQSGIFKNHATCRKPYVQSRRSLCFICMIQFIKVSNTSFTFPQLQ